VKIVCISDTHGYFPDLPDGDVLIHGGDLTSRGTYGQVMEGLIWLARQPHRHKLLIAGNHDFWFEQTPEAAVQAAIPAGITYLQDEAVVIDGVTFYGSPWQPRFFNWAFNLDRPQLAAVWAKIPLDTQVLITHGPSRGIRDQTERGERVGCVALRDRIAQLPDLRLHVCGHIHEDYGIHQHGAVQSVNASICDLIYRPRNAPIVVEL
jgi:Icc-related predicted phosphoesterase